MMSLFPKRRADVTFREVGGETLILDRKHDEVHQLNHTASYVWELCDGKTSLEDIARKMAREFCVAPMDVEEDVASLVTQFAALHLLEDQ